MQAPRGGGGFLGKRKEREYYPPYPSASSSSSEQAVLLQRPPPPQFARPDPRVVRPDHRPAVRLGAKPPLPQPGAAGPKLGGVGVGVGGGGNKLLAGYLAHEFLRCGTLLGERRLDAPTQKEKEPAAGPELSRRYAEVSRLLMAGGARIPASSTPRSSAAGSGLRSDRPAVRGGAALPAGSPLLGG